MARYAKLISIDAVREMTAALQAFGDETLAAIDELDASVRRAVEWISHDRKEFWNNEVRRGWERVGEARVELEKAITYRKMGDQSPSCRQERADLERAKQRVHDAEEINHALPRWVHAVEHAVKELEGNKSVLSDWLRGDLPRALAALKLMAQSLDSYASATSSAGKKKPATASADDAETSPSGEEDQKEETKKKTADRPNEDDLS